MNPTRTEIIGTALFGLAVVHTFLAGKFKAWGHKYPEGSKRENLLHLLGETEAVFGIWAGVLFFAIAVTDSWHGAVEYIETRNYTEPMFVFVIMTIAATRPVLIFATKLIDFFARLLRGVPEALSFYLACLIIGPLLGSFITEPAAMTITALLLLERYYKRGLSRTFMYSTLGVLFVNVSIGGTLTHFAAPPVLMVAAKWKWSLGFMVGHFGWKAALAVIVNAVGVTLFNRNTFRQLTAKEDEQQTVYREKGEEEAPDGAEEPSSERPLMKPPWWIIAIHLGFLAFVVVTNHHWPVFLGAFVFFLGILKVTWEFQTRPKIIEGLLVGFFLCGLVVLGGLQSWWLEPVITSLGERSLFLGATGLTAITDNAALTYLGSQVNGMADGAKYALVGGAVAGGGLTLIANAPNPAGYSILKDCFEDKATGKEFSALALLAAAAIPTLVAMFFLWFMPR